MEAPLPLSAKIGLFCVRALTCLRTPPRCRLNEARGTPGKQAEAVRLLKT
jgi:hypothetical protein